MPRPRFSKLEPDKQSKILAIAASEFAENGFEGASYNRIIERAGLSKGAMYYYFDDKTDLYVTVLQNAVGDMMAAVSEGLESVGGYWGQFEHMFKRSVAFALEHPEFGALARGFMNAPERLRTEGALESIVETYRQQMTEMIEAGQALGEVRTDLPMPLLVSVTFAMGEAIDRWWLDHIEEFEDADIDKWARELIGLFRRVAEPRGDEP
ncbi:MAG: TetR/AcrR family transcriptional regulator [Deltaproteobacteria bacterium]|jgi:AcrR family transcriptional regulator